ncbi:hypothetical protein [Streptomyces sp. B27]|uniref:hypothetical protein n=1 Tax=Streptomyces sp. B27 TaxID=2485015 RepID=UPI000FDBBC66|nr:hypothetical protein [Streptomyces sp. B27]
MNEGRRFVRYQVIPLATGLAAMAAIVLPDGDNLSWIRFGAGGAAFLALSFAVTWTLARTDRRHRH